MKPVKPKALLLTIILFCILGGIEIDIFVPSIPQIMQYYHLAPFEVQLLLSINFIAYSIGVLFAGVLGDRFGRRLIVLSGIWVFIAASILCVLAPNFLILVGGRLLQGIGAAATSLVFVEIVENYPPEKQAGLMGLVNGSTTIAMAFAPVIGSFVTLYFNWRGNFEILLITAVFSAVVGYMYLPYHPGNKDIVLSPKAYLPLLTSYKSLTFVAVISLLVVPYWIFIGMSPILYIKSLGVSLNYFGFYQGALAAAFSVLSMISPKILNIFGQRKCLAYGLVLCVISTIIIFLLTIFNVKSPLLITITMIFLAISVLFPLNILLPLAINVIPEAKSRSTSFITCFRLLLMTIGIQSASYFYNGTGIPIFIAMFLSMGGFLILAAILHKRNWINLSH